MTLRMFDDWWKSRSAEANTLAQSLQIRKDSHSWLKPNPQSPAPNLLRCRPKPRPRRAALKAKAAESNSVINMANEESTARAKGNIANLKPFKPGQSGNPKGRPKGSRDKINEAFLSDLCAAWAEHGVDAMKKVATADPATFVRVVASLIPKEVKVDGDINHEHNHQHRAISETADWIAGVLAAGPGRAPQKPLPN